jgi:hypothetical protein
VARWVVWPARIAGPTLHYAGFNAEYVDNRHVSLRPEVTKTIIVFAT